MGAPLPADTLPTEPARYHGLITYQSQAIPNDSGSIQIKVGRDGAYSGKANTGQSQYRFNGTLDSQGEDTAEFKARVKIEPYGHFSWQVGHIHLVLDPTSETFMVRVDEKN